MTIATAALKTAEFHFDKGDIELAKKAIRLAAGQAKRPATALRAAGLMMDIELRLAQYEDPKPIQNKHDGEIVVRVMDTRKNAD